MTRDIAIELGQLGIRVNLYFAWPDHDGDFQQGTRNLS
jgi:hypothetical protein